MQRAGSHLSPFKVSEWAKRPFAELDLFMVGEAYHPMRGWIEGALQSAQEALREGWDVENNDLKQKRDLSREQTVRNNLDLILFS